MEESSESTAATAPAVFVASVAIPTPDILSVDLARANAELHALSVAYANDLFEKKVSGEPFSVLNKMLGYRDERGTAYYAQYLHNLPVIQLENRAWGHYLNYLRLLSRWLRKGPWASEVRSWEMKEKEKMLRRQLQTFHTYRQAIEKQNDIWRLQLQRADARKRELQLQADTDFEETVAFLCMVKLGFIVKEELRQ